MKSVRYICTGLIGLVFCLSAVFKLMDPVGTGLVVEAYLKFLHIGFLLPASKLIGETLSLCEATVGIGLLTGVFRRLFAIATFALLSFFTLVSILLLVFNPEMDCGCFGQAIHLTHFQTFVKNIILLLLAFAAFVPFRCLDLLAEGRLIAFILGMLIMIVFSIISLIHVPLVDYTAFAPSHTIVGEDDVMAGTEEYPLLPLCDNAGNDCSDVILDGSVLLISYYDDSELTQDEILSVADFAQSAMDAGFMPYVLSTSYVEIPGLESYVADYKTLITLNRGNGGYTFLDDGYIITKFSGHKSLSYEVMESMSDMDSTDVYIKTATGRTVLLQVFFVCFFAVILLL